MSARPSSPQVNLSARSNPPRGSPSRWTCQPGPALPEAALRRWTRQPDPAPHSPEGSPPQVNLPVRPSSPGKLLQPSSAKKRKAGWEEAIPHIFRRKKNNLEQRAELCRGVVLRGMLPQVEEISQQRQRAVFKEVSQLIFKHRNEQEEMGGYGVVSFVSFFIFCSQCAWCFM